MASSSTSQEFLQPCTKAVVHSPLFHCLTLWAFGTAYTCSWKTHCDQGCKQGQGSAPTTWSYIPPWSVVLHVGVRLHSTPMCKMTTPPGRDITITRMPVIWQSYFLKGCFLSSLWNLMPILRAVLAYGDSNLLVTVGIVRFAGATAKFDRMCYWLHCVLLRFYSWG